MQLITLGPIHRYVKYYHELEELIREILRDKGMKVD